MSTNVGAQMQAPFQWGMTLCREAVRSSTEQRSIEAAALDVAIRVCKLALGVFAMLAGVIPALLGRLIQFAAKTTDIPTPHSIPQPTSTEDRRADEDVDSVDSITFPSSPGPVQAASEAPEPNCAPVLVDIGEGELLLPARKQTDEVAILFFPVQDHNNAFTERDSDLMQRLEWMASEYHIILKRVPDIYEAVNIAEMIKEQEKKICHIELAGHGTETSLTWSNSAVGQIRADETQEATLVDEALARLSRTLEDWASIVCLSCSNGGEVPGRENNLQHVARIAYGHRVIGTTIENGKHLDLLCTSIKPFEMQWFDQGVNVTGSCQYD